MRRLTRVKYVSRGDIVRYALGVSVAQFAIRHETELVTSPAVVSPTGGFLDGRAVVRGEGDAIVLKRASALCPWRDQLWATSYALRWLSLSWQHC
jgi:hypothetical protein